MKVKWTYELCEQEALTYKNRTDFKKKSYAAYYFACKNKWMNLICSHMLGALPHNYWTKEKCATLAIKYDNKKQFRKECASAYNAAYKHNWISDICSHMIPLGNKYLRHVYMYLFPDDSIYFGLTCDINRRNISHLNCPKSKVYKHILLTNQQPILEILTTEPIDVNLAQSLEVFLIKDFKEKKYKILNGNNGGGIGRNNPAIIWTKEKCLNEALKYKHKNEFHRKSIMAYKASRKYGWFDEITKHMTKPIHTYWTYERCQNEALKYTSRNEFNKVSNSAYCIAAKNKWLNTICSHMISCQKPRGYWNYDTVSKEALKYTRRVDFSNNSARAYNYALENNILDLICKHMPIWRKPDGYWTFEKCQEVALKCTSKKEFGIKYSTAYIKAHRKDWIKNICKHMTTNN